MRQGLLPLLMQQLPDLPGRVVEPRLAGGHHKLDMHLVRWGGSGSGAGACSGSRQRAWNQISSKCQRMVPPQCMHTTSVRLIAPPPSNLPP
jgi:hypothetical protein